LFVEINQSSQILLKKIKSTKKYIYYTTMSVKAPKRNINSRNGTKNC